MEQSNYYNTSSELGEILDETNVNCIELDMKTITPPLLSTSVDSSSSSNQQPKKYSRPTDSNCLHYLYYLPKMPNSLMNHVMGKNGKIFKNITKQCNAEYIWYDRKNKLIDIYAYDSLTIEKCISKLSNQLCIILVLYICTFQKKGQLEYCLLQWTIRYYRENLQHLTFYYQNTTIPFYRQHTNMSILIEYPINI